MPGIVESGALCDSEHCKCDFFMLWVENTGFNEEFSNFVQLLSLR